METKILLEEKEARTAERAFFSPPIVEQLLRVAFFDLDDTLIPTDWARKAFLEIGRGTDKEFQKEGSRNSPFSLKPDLGVRTLFPSTPMTTQRSTEATTPNLYSYSTLSSQEATYCSSAHRLSVTVNEIMSHHHQSLVRQTLEHLVGGDFDERAARLIEKASKLFGVVIIVTNARSAAWLQVVGSLFPKFKAQLSRLSIPIVRAAATGPASRRNFHDMADYFHYWTNLKKVQFYRIIDATVSALRRLAGQNTSSSETQISLKLSLRETLKTPSLHPEEHCPEKVELSQSRGSTVQESDNAPVLRINKPPSVLSAPISGEVLSTGLNGATPAVGRLEKTKTHNFSVSPKVLPDVFATLSSPRSHKREHRALESLLLQWDHEATSFNTELLTRVIAHQVERCVFLHRQRLEKQKQSQIHPHHRLPGTLAFSHSAITTTKGLPIGRQTGLQIICVGDSEFELCAARELAKSYSEVEVTSCGLIKCRTGLDPVSFCQQLADIEDALQFLLKCSNHCNTLGTSREPSKAKRIGQNVIAEFTTRLSNFETLWLGDSLAAPRQPFLVKLASSNGCQKLPHLESATHSVILNTGGACLRGTESRISEREQRHNQTTKRGPAIHFFKASTLTVAPAATLNRPLEREPDDCHHKCLQQNQHKDVATFADPQKRAAMLLAKPAFGKEATMSSDVSHTHILSLLSGDTRGPVGHRCSSTEEWMASAPVKPNDFRHLENGNHQTYPPIMAPPYRSPTVPEAKDQPSLVCPSQGVHRQQYKCFVSRPTSTVRKAQPRAHRGESTSTSHSQTPGHTALPHLPAMCGSGSCEPHSQFSVGIPRQRSDLMWTTRSVSFRPKSDVCSRIRPPTHPGPMRRTRSPGRTALIRSSSCFPERKSLRRTSATTKGAEHSGTGIILPEHTLGKTTDALTPLRVRTPSWVVN